MTPANLTRSLKRRATAPGPRRFPDSAEFPEVRAYVREYERINGLKPTVPPDEESSR